MMHRPCMLMPSAMAGIAGDHALRVLQKTKVFFCFIRGR